MAVVRRNILGPGAVNIQARDQYIQGVKLLKQEFLGPTTQDLGVIGPVVQVSTYDLFVVWHHVAMFRFTPPSQSDRNSAHRGPVFLPWHRHMLILLEFQLQRVLGDDDFGIPYWDWAADGDLPSPQQLASPIWGAQCMGGTGNPVTTGPFAFNAENSQAWRVRVASNSNGQLFSVNRGLRRNIGMAGVSTLPTTPQVGQAVLISTYDSSPWNTSTPNFRNRLEGWRPLGNAPGLHNRVHVWVGGDMGPSSSPNDPVFYLNHCNVDRIWAAWQAPLPIDSYLPDMTAPPALLGHRIDDEMYSLLTDPVTPRQMLDVSELYSYDTLDTA